MEVHFNTWFCFTLDWNILIYYIWEKWYFNMFLIWLVYGLWIWNILRLKVKMQENEMHFHNFFVFFVFFLKRKNSVQIAKTDCAFYGDGAITESNVCKWFSRSAISNISYEHWKSVQSTWINKLLQCLDLHFNLRFASLTTKKDYDFLREWSEARSCRKWNESVQKLVVTWRRW